MHYGGEEPFNYEHKFPTKFGFSDLETRPSNTISRCTEQTTISFEIVSGYQASVTADVPETGEVFCA